VGALEHDDVSKGGKQVGFIRRSTLTYAMLSGYIGHDRVHLGTPRGGRCKRKAAKIPGREGTLCLGVQLTQFATMVDKVLDERPVNNVGAVYAQHIRQFL
jgi:hypothetical protein